MAFAGRRNKTRPERQSAYLSSSPDDFRRTLALSGQPLSCLLREAQQARNLIGVGATHSVYRLPRRLFQGYGVRIVTGAPPSLLPFTAKNLVDSGHPLVNDVQAGVPLLHVVALDSARTKFAEIVRRLPGIPVCGPKRELVAVPHKYPELSLRLMNLMNGAEPIDSRHLQRVWREIRRSPEKFWTIQRNLKYWREDLVASPARRQETLETLNKTERDDECDLGACPSNWRQKILPVMDYLDARNRANLRRFKAFSALPIPELQKLPVWMQRLEPAGLELDLDHPANLISLPDNCLGVVDTRRRRPGDATWAERLQRLNDFYPLRFVEPRQQAEYDAAKKQIADKLAVILSR